MGTEEKTDYRKSTPEVLYQMRKTVIALFKKEKSVEEIIEVTDFSERTVRETIRKYKSGGMAALKPKKRGRKAGEKRTLTPNQEKEVVRNITDKNPDQLKMKCALWTRDAVRQLIKDKYGIDMPIRTVGMYLQRWGFTVQRPAKQAIEQKPEAVQRWLKEEYSHPRRAFTSSEARIHTPAVWVVYYRPILSSITSNCSTSRKSYSTLTTRHISAPFNFVAFISRPRSSTSEPFQYWRPFRSKVATERYFRSNLTSPVQ